MARPAEQSRLEEDLRREKNWKRWGPYLSERQWGTVREDYSAEGESWSDVSHEDARSRAYRWGEDGLLGLTDRRCRLCFAIALWNERDPILKERLFGLTGPQGNHGEDVKELYYYLDATPTYSYAKSLYKYPQAEFPYRRLLEDNAARGKTDPELELAETGVFDEDRYFDVHVEYAKADHNDILIRVSVHNRGPDPAPLRLLPTVWFRNTWSWGRSGDGYWPEPQASKTAEPDTSEIELVHYSSLSTLRFRARTPTEVLFTNNETNATRLFDSDEGPAYAKDAFHEYVVNGKTDAVNPDPRGTKAALHYRLDVGAGESVHFDFRLTELAAADGPAFDDFDDIFALRLREANEFYASVIPASLDEEQRQVARQAYAGLLHTNQFYHLVVRHWLDGDPTQPPPERTKEKVRNAEWRHLFNLDVLSMPDKWEYPWYAAWDLAFHMVPYARLDPAFAKHQLQLLLREWYMHPNGQIPAYEFKFDDVNPPVHAWAVWRVFQIDAARGEKDYTWLASCFQKLLLNYGWWVNRKDLDGNNLFGGGFLGLDNIGVFDRSQPLPGGARLDQADGTAWMAFFAGTMLAIALELAKHDRSHADMASRFFEHFIEIVDAMNHLGGAGLWNDEDGFYYDHLVVGGRVMPLRTRSLVGLAPLFTVQILDTEIDNLPGFSKRLRWFLDNRRDLHRTISYLEFGRDGRRLLAVPTRERLERTLRYMLDESEFLSPYGIRSLSRAHLDAPFSFTVDGRELQVRYTPAESDTYMFGGNSNWRGPVWFPLNFLLIEALEIYGDFYGDQLLVEHPTGSGRRMPLTAVARDLARRLTKLFVPDPTTGQRPCHGLDRRYADKPGFRDLVLFYEYFDGDNGRGCGASHQTGWTALVASCLEKTAGSGPE